MKLYIMLRKFTTKLVASDRFTLRYSIDIIFKYRVDGVVDRHKVKNMASPPIFRIICFQSLPLWVRDVTYFLYSLRAVMRNRLILK